MSRKLPPRLYVDAGSWRIRDGAARYRTGCPESDAAGAEKKLAEYIRHKYQPATGPDPLIVDVLLKYAKEHAPTLKAKRQTAHNIGNLVRWWGNKRISEITVASCRAFHGVRPATAVRRDLEILRAACNRYTREHGLRTVYIVLPPKPEPRERWLTREEARRLRRSSMKWSWLYRFVILGLLTGTRSGPILQMKWSWIDLDAHLMRRREPGSPEDSRKKTPPARISKRLARLMRRWKRDGCSWVVHYRGRPVQGLQRVWNRAVKEAGLEDVVPHSLRHTRATWLAQSGVNAHEAAGHLGMSVETYYRIYAKHSPDFQKEAAEI